MIERLYPNTPKFEMFARTRRPDWDVWGNEAEVAGEGVTDADISIQPEPRP